MIVEVVGKSKRPYEMTDQNGKVRKGLSCRISLRVGTYASDPDNGIYGDGYSYIELRCPESIVDNVSCGDTLSIDMDDKKTRIKSAMLQIENGSFMPI